MANEKEKAASPETGAEFNDILATDLYGRTLRIGLVMSYLVALWLDRKLPAPDYFGSPSEPMPLPGKKEIESGAKDAAIAHTLLAIFPNIYNEDQTLNKEAASKALENYLDAKDVVNAIPNKHPDQLTTVAGDVKKNKKANHFLIRFSHKYHSENCIKRIKIVAICSLVAKPCGSNLSSLIPCRISQEIAQLTASTAYSPIFLISLNLLSFISS